MAAFVPSMGARQEESPMMKTLDELHRLGNEGMDAGIQAFVVAAKGAQAIGTEYADYARKSFEHSTGAVEKLLSARTLDGAFELQSEYARTAYEGFVAQATRLGTLYADVAKQTCKPLESYASRLKPTA
jgi:hypothetical protein